MNTLRIQLWIALVLVMTFSGASFGLEELENIDMPFAEKSTRTPLVGTTYYDHVPESDTVLVSEIIEVNIDTTTWVERGCEYTSKTNDFQPVVEVNKCGKDNYRTEITKVDGNLWPLEVGSKSIHYYDRIFSDGRKVTAKIECLTLYSVRIKIVAGVYDTYKIRCSDQFRTDIFYYSPRFAEIFAINNRELIKRVSPRGDVEVFEEGAESDQLLKALKPKRIALIIGNSNYESVGELINPTHDAKALADLLEKLGFNVTLKLDIGTRRGFKTAVRQYTETLSNDTNTVGLFYYAGHAIQADGVNYMIPINADIETVPDLEDETVTLEYITRSVEYAQNTMNIFLIDACRDNPFRSFSRTLKKGLASQNSPEGSIIMFATSPGKTALDGIGSNSPFANNLLKNLGNPNEHILLMLQNVIKGVRVDTNDSQTPWVQSSLYGDFYFNKQ